MDAEALVKFLSRCVGMVASRTATIETVGCTCRCSVIPRCDDMVVLDDDSAYLAATAVATGCNVLCQSKEILFPRRSAVINTCDFFFHFYLTDDASLETSSIGIYLLRANAIFA